jgi:Tfp pilus assembly protein PilF
VNAPAAQSSELRASRKFLYVALCGLVIAGLILASLTGGGLAMACFLGGSGVAVVAQYVSILLHETAHAAVARVLGLRVFKVIVGSGPAWLTWKWAGVPVEIRRHPFGGLTYIGHESPRGFRLRNVLVVAAGPLVSLLWFLGLFWLVYDERLMQQLPVTVQRALEIPGWLLVWPAASTVVYSLWPHMCRAEGKQIPNDGLQLLQTPWLKPAEIIDSVGMTYAQLANQSLEAGDSAGAKTWCDRGLQQARGNWSLHAIAGWIESAQSPPSAVEHYRQALASPQLPVASRCQVLDALACLPLYTNHREYLAQADEWSREALELDPQSITLKGTRGGVLLELGHDDEAVKLLENCFEHGSEKTDKPISACYLALAAARRGDYRKADEWLTRSKQLDPHCRVLPRIEEELVRLRTKHA